MGACRVRLAVAGIEGADELLRHNLLEYAELLLFLLAAMTYVNTLEERHLFAALRSWLVSQSFSLRGIFWITGALAFALSPVLDNLTTALVMGAVVLAVGRAEPRFVTRPASMSSWRQTPAAHSARSGTSPP